MELQIASKISKILLPIAFFPSIWYLLPSHRFRYRLTAIIKKIFQLIQNSKFKINRSANERKSKRLWGFCYPRSYFIVDFKHCQDISQVFTCREPANCNPISFHVCSYFTNTISRNGHCFHIKPNSQFLLQLGFNMIYSHYQDFLHYSVTELIFIILIYLVV